jgi:hypothetical protein
MNSFIANAEWVRNTKTGTIGRVKSRFVRRDGKNIVVVQPVLYGNKDAYWLAANVEAE